MIGSVALAAQHPGDLQAVDARQTQVEDDQVGLLAARLDERRLPVARLHDREPALFEVRPHELDDLRLIIDNEYLGCHPCSARVR